jgi:hypothetical protein
MSAHLPEETAVRWPISDVPAPTNPAIYDEPESDRTREQLEAAIDKAVASAHGVPREHEPYIVETRWRTVEEAREYRAWLEREAIERPNNDLSRGERKILRRLQRDPRTRNHPTDPLEFKRIAGATVKRRTKAERRARLARLSAAGAKARARALPRPIPTPESIDD